MKLRMSQNRFKENSDIYACSKFTKYRPNIINKNHHWKLHSRNYMYVTLPTSTETTGKLTLATKKKLH